MVTIIFVTIEISVVENTINIMKFFFVGTITDDSQTSIM